MAQQPPQTVLPADMMQPHAQQPIHHAVNSYYPDNPNDLTGGLPINLDSLRDGPPGSKPFYPYSTLIRYGASLLESVALLTMCCVCAGTSGMQSRARQIRSYSSRIFTMLLNQGCVHEIPTFAALRLPYSGDSSRTFGQHLQDGRLVSPSDCADVLHALDL